MQQELLLNVIPFTAPIQEKEFAFYTTKCEGYYPIHKDDLKDLLGKNINGKTEFGNWLYTDFQSVKEGAIVIKINLTKSIIFANHYYRYLIRNYFKNVADITCKNFTNEIEVWFYNQNESAAKYKVYNQFTLKIQNARITKGPELVISSDGTIKIYNKSIAELQNFKTELYNWINCDGELTRWKDLTDKQKLKHEKNYPVINRFLRPHFGISSDIISPKNRYPKHHNLLEDFYNKYLSNELFRKIIPLSTGGFLKPDNSLIRIINSESNELQYGKGIGREPKKEFKSKGPYKPVPPPNNVKFFFIYQKSDRETAVKAIYEYFLHGFKGEYPFPAMQHYIKQPFEIEKDGSIVYDNLNEAVSIVEKAIKNKTQLPNTKYFAIYINPISKSDKDENLNNIYYRIKEILLYENISMQVIRSENLYRNGQRNKDFNTFLPHIQIAILAKLGGIPWRLNHPIINELIVGVGAFSSVTHQTKYIGSAFCFNNEGIFKGFDCFKRNDTISLAGSIREAVQNFININHNVSRLIIHFYKEISKKELKPIINTLHSLGLNIPVIVVTINKTESKELLAFDIASTNKMPYSGTIIKVGNNEYLLFNSTRYDIDSKPTQRDYHFPIKINLSCSTEGILDNTSLAEQLIDQVYQFSKMYWTSINQQNLPVTIKYPAMVAKIYPYFQHDKLSEFAKNSLWFL